MDHWRHYHQRIMSVNITSNQVSNAVFYGGLTVAILYGIPTLYNSYRRVRAEERLKSFNQQHTHQNQQELDQCIVCNEEKQVKALTTITPKDQRYFLYTLGGGSLILGSYLISGAKTYFKN